ncbi:1-deoxy-D-xylulose-5-phosphate synthase [Bienertia sinuspersici]
MIMMANLQANHHIISISRKLFQFGESKLYSIVIKLPSSSSSLVPQKRSKCLRRGLVKVKCVSDNSNISALVQQSPQNTDEDLGMMIDQTAEVEIRRNEGFDEIEYLVKEYGWKVRKMIEDKSEMRKVAQIQAEAFHVPAPFFDDWFFQFFKPAKEDDTATSTKSHRQDGRLVGVVDVTALRDNDVLQHLGGAPEYLYVSGIAVSNNFRRQKVATVLLKACEVIAVLWGHEYLALRAYEDDRGARSLYTNAGYRLVSKDPLWVTLIGRKRMIALLGCSEDDKECKC